MKKRITSLFYSETGKATVIVAIGNISNAFFSTLFVYLTSKVLPAFEFGLFSVCLTTWFLLTELSEFGLGNLTVRLAGVKIKTGEKTAQSYYKIGFIIRSLQGILILLLFLFFGKNLAIFLGQEKLRPLFLIFASGIFWFLILNSFFPMILTEKKFFLYSFIFIFLGIGRLLLFFIILKIDLINIVSVSMIFTVMPLLAFLLLIIIIPLEFLKRKINKKQIYEVFNSIKWLILYGVFIALSNRSNVYFLTKIKGPKDVGIYNLAYLFSSAFSLFSGSFSTVFLPKISGLKNKIDVQTYFMKAIKVIFLLVVVMIISTLPIRLIIDFLLSQKYPRIGSVFLILMLGMIFLILAVPANTTLWVLNRPKIFTLVSLSQLVLSFIFNYFLINKLGLNGAAISFSIVSFFSFLLVNLIVFKFFKLHND